jgi:transglutaminase-like putative cysteine protease
LHEELPHDHDEPQEAATAVEVFARKRGVARDLTHIFIGAARSFAIPARYIAGYLCADSTIEQHGGHAWAESFVPGLGWVGFDVVNCVCPTEAYVRVAVGLDALGAVPVRGTRYGTGDEKLAVAIKVDQ